MKKAKYFSAVWCGPCKVFKPIMKELSDEGYDIEFIDGDENQDLAVQYNIRSVPTTIIQIKNKQTIVYHVVLVVIFQTKVRLI